MTTMLLAGLTVAADLARMGHGVTIFEALHAAGGVLMYGIPEFRLPKTIVQREIHQLEDLGVELKVNHVIGRTFTVDDLFNELGYDAVLLNTAIAKAAGVSVGVVDDFRVVGGGRGRDLLAVGGQLRRILHAGVRGEARGNTPGSRDGPQVALPAEDDGVAADVGVLHEPSGRAR